MWLSLKLIIAISSSTMIIFYNEPYIAKQKNVGNNPLKTKSDPFQTIHIQTEQIYTLTVIIMNSYFIALVRDITRDRNRYEYTRLLSMDTIIDKYVQHHPMIHKSIINKLVKHSWELVPTRAY